MPINYANTNMLTGVEFNNWQTTYSTVQSNSATWSSVISGATYTRWQLTGNPPISSFSINGAVSNNANAYRVTVGSVLQDPASYTINNSPGTITFSEAPALSSNIIVLETIVGFGSNGNVASTVISNSANWQNTYTTVQSNSSTWNTGGGMTLLAAATASDSAEILFDNEFDSTLYSEYELRFQGVQPATDNVTLRVQLRDSGGNLTATYREGQVGQRIDAAGSANASNINSTAGFSIATSGNASNELNTGVIVMTPISGQWCHMRSQSYTTGISVDRYIVCKAGAYEATTAPTGLRIYCSSGNISIGTFQLYGIKK